MAKTDAKPTDAKKAKDDKAEKKAEPEPKKAATPVPPTDPATESALAGDLDFKSSDRPAVEHKRKLWPSNSWFEHSKY